MQTEQQIQNPTPMNEDSAPDLNVENTQQSVVAEEHQHQHQQHPHYVHDGLVDMVALQTIASQSAPLFATSASTGDASSGGDSQNSPANGHHLHHEGVKRSVSPEGLSRTRPAPEDGEDGEGGEERDKKRQRRLLQNRQSAALSRQRKKEYLGGLERKNNELDAENKVLKQTVYSNDVRIRELESRLSFFIKQNDDFKNLLRTSDKVDELNRLLAQAYSTLVPGLLNLSFHAPPHDAQQQQQQHLSAPTTPAAAQPPAASPPPESTHTVVEQQHLAPLSALLASSEGGESSSNNNAEQQQQTSAPAADMPDEVPPTPPPASAAPEEAVVEGQ